MLTAAPFVVHVVFTRWHQVCIFLNMWKPVLLWCWNSIVLNSMKNAYTQPSWPMC